MGQSAQPSKCRGVARDATCENQPSADVFASKWIVLGWLGQPGALLNPHTLIFLLFIAAIVGPMVFRMVTPMPTVDMKAIELFLKNRNEVPICVRKTWIGGPSHWGGRGLYRQTGRPYRVTAQSSDGSRWTYDLAADGKDALGNPRMNQRLGGRWSPVMQ